MDLPLLRLLGSFNSSSSQLHIQHALPEHTFVTCCLAATGFSHGLYSILSIHAFISTFPPPRINSPLRHTAINEFSHGLNTDHSHRRSACTPLTSHTTRNRFFLIHTLDSSCFPGFPTSVYLSIRRQSRTLSTTRIMSSSVIDGISGKLTVCSPIRFATGTSSEDQPNLSR